MSVSSFSPFSYNPNSSWIQSVQRKYPLNQQPQAVFSALAIPALAMQCPSYIIPAYDWLKAMGSSSLNATQREAAEKITTLFQRIHVVQLEDWKKLSPSALDELDGLIYALSGHPSTDDLLWGQHHRCDDARRLYAALMLQSISASDRAQVFGLVYRSSKPVTSDPLWGEHHASDNLPLLDRCIYAVQSSTWLATIEGRYNQQHRFDERSKPPIKLCRSS